MKISKLSIVTVAALGMFSTTQAVSLEEAIKGTEISGYAYGRTTAMFGRDANGSSFRSRVFTSVQTGAFGGFSIRSFALFTQGGGSPDGGTFLQNSKNPGSPLSINILNIHGQQTFENTATTLKGGKIGIDTPFSDNVWDLGYGASISNQDIEGITVSAQAFGAWQLDNSNTLNADSDFTTDRPLIIAGIEGDAKQFSGLGFKLYAANANKVFDYLIFGGANYNIGGLTFGSEIAVLQVNPNNNALKPNNIVPTVDPVAKLRGIYNIELAYSDAETNLSAKAGFTGSFGDGYGALFSNGAFNMGGQIWYDTVGSGANGFGMVGVGGTKHHDGKKTDIMVGYFGIKYKGQAISVGLDYAYITGNNNYKLMKKGVVSHSKPNKPSTGNIDATFHELSLTTSYAFNEKTKLNVLVGNTFGDVQMGRARATIQYSF